MPTASERARVEAAGWAQLAEHWSQEAAPDLWQDRPPTENHVVVFHDPKDDLHHRGHRWGHHFEETDLESLALFAAGLAQAEADAWDSNQPDVATKAYEDRRFLLGDRVIHWAVPWLETVRLHHPPYETLAQSDRDFLLRLADEMRVAPILPGTEGLVVDGDDSFGPTSKWQGHHKWLTSLWSGALVFKIHEGADLALYYADSALRWEAMAIAHDGSAQLWMDLAIRAANTARLLE